MTSSDINTMNYFKLYASKKEMNSKKRKEKSSLDMIIKFCISGTKISKSN